MPKRLVAKNPKKKTSRPKNKSQVIGVRKISEITNSITLLESEVKKSRNIIKENSDLISSLSEKIEEYNIVINSIKELISNNNSMIKIMIEEFNNIRLPVLPSSGSAKSRLGILVDQGGADPINSDAGKIR